MFSTKSKKEDFKNKIRIQISTCRQQLKGKNDFLGKQYDTLKTKYANCGPDFAKTFENIVGAEVYVKGANDLLSDLTVLQQNADLLFDKKPLPSQIQVAFEKCYAVAKLNKQKDLLNLLSPITKIHNCMTDIVASHESLVYLGTDLINKEDVQTYYPTIKAQCRLEENPYVRQSLAKYSFVLSPEIQIYQNSYSQVPNIPQTGFTNITPQYDSTNLPPQYNSINMPPQHDPTNLPPQFNSMNMPPQFNSTNLPPQYNSTNLPPQYNSTNLPPQYNSMNMPPQFNSMNMPPQYNPVNVQPQNLQFPQQPQLYNQDKANDDDSGLPNELFISVSPQAK